MYYYWGNTTIFLKFGDQLVSQKVGGKNNLVHMVVLSTSVES